MPIDRLGDGGPSRWFSDWRRQWTNTHLIDIDALEYCDGCKTHLALIEVTGSSGHKPTSRLCALAADAALPAYLLRVLDFDGLFPHFRIEQVHPPGGDVVDLWGDEMGEWLLDIHDHGCGRIPRGKKRC